MMSRDLSVISLCALMIEGIHIGDHLVLVALGIDEAGEKHVLGLYEGSTENATVCTGLLDHVVYLETCAPRY
jgi:putative transposase